MTLLPIRRRRPTFDRLEDRTNPSTFQWIGAGANSSWNTAGNWTLVSGTGTYPNAVGDVAQFTGAYTADQKPTITTAITVGEIDFGGAGYTGNFGVTLTKTAGSLTLTNTSGPAVINVLPSANTTAATVTFTSLASGLNASAGGLIVNQSSSKLNLTITIPIKTGSFGEYATVNAGTLLQNDNATTTTLGPTSTFTVNNGGTLAIGSTATLGVGQNNLGVGTITLNAGSTFKVNNSNNPVSLANNIVFGPDANVILAGAPILFLGGTITLNGNNTLKVNSTAPAAGLSPTTTMIAESIVGISEAGNKLTIGTAGSGILSLGDVTFSGPNSITLAGKAINLVPGSSYPGGLPSTPTLTVNAPTTITNELGGEIASLAVAGSSSVTLAGANSYTGGISVSTGTLLLGGASNSASAITLASGATLGGSGTVGNLTLGSGTLRRNLTDASTYDQLVVGGIVDLTGATLSLNIGTVNLGDTFTILTVAGADPASVVGSFVGLPTSGLTFAVGARQFRIDYAGGDGNDVVLTATGDVPALIGDPVFNGASPYLSSTNFTQQHSLVESVVYSFGQAVALTADNLTLTGTNGTTLAPSVLLTPNADSTVWTVTFAGDGVSAATGSLGDGRYRLTLAVAGLANTFDFFRLLGDLDGNGFVDFSDFQSFNSSFNRPTSDPLFVGAADFDGSGTVDFSDFQILNSNFNHGV